MKLIHKFLYYLKSFTYEGLINSIKNIEVEPPDLVVYIGDKRVVLSRFLVCREVEYNVSEVGEGEAKSILESYKALIKSLPEGVHIYLVKENIDSSSLLRKIGNEILNIQADLEGVVEESKRIKLNLRLEKLKKLYDLLVGGKPFIRVALVVVYRVESTSKEIAKSLADYYEVILTSTFRNTYGLVLERASYDDIVQLLLGSMGIIEKPRVKQLQVELDRVSHLQPLVMDRLPRLDKAVIIGIELETKHPVEIGLDELYKHFAIIGPTGKGKTTLMASIIEQVVSSDLQRVVAFDFKGDLSKYLPRGLVRVITPVDAPINILEKPRDIDRADWKLIVVEALSHAGGLPSESVLRALNILENTGLKSVESPNVASILAPFRDLLSSESRMDVLLEALRRESILVNVEGYGVAYQNAYIAICTGIIRYLLLRSIEEANPLIFIDDAWRVLELRTIRELVREGRSRRIGVVVSTQSPSDFPQGLVENIHAAVLFGSRNREYIYRSINIFNIPEQLALNMPRLGIGEGLFVNTATRTMKLIKTFNPSFLEEKTREATGVELNKH